MQARFSHFGDWVAKILPPDKMEGFLNLWTAPSETSELAESIFGELYRVFQAENPYTDHKFKNSSDLIPDFEDFLEKKVKTQKFWTTQYWNELKTDQNSILVVDLPATQNTSRPEPYIYFVDIGSVIDAEVTREGCFEYVIFWTTTKGQVMVLDDQAWTLWQVEIDQQGNADMEKLTFLSTIPHSLGRVPAKPLYFQPINKELTLVNHNPVTKSLSRMDWLLFWEIAKKYLETYAPFPIYATYSEANDGLEVTADKGEEYFTGGRENLIAPGSKLIAVTETSPAKNLANRKLVGPGTIQRFDAPRDGNDPDLLTNPVQVIPAEEVSLTYAQEEAGRKHDLIFSRCVGRGGDVINNQATNELQVQSTFESRVNILSGIRGRIEETQKYIYELLGELRYGNKVYQGTDVSLGDMYYLTTVKDQQEELKSAKEAGLPTYELQNQIQGIYRNKYREQPQLLGRNQILSELEPYPALTIQEVAELVGKGYASEDKLKVKIDFESLVRRFEREQMSVVDFASVLPLATKIDTINSKLLEYVAEDSTSKPQPGDGNTGGPGERPLPPVAGKEKV